MIKWTGNPGGLTSKELISPTWSGGGKAFFWTSLILDTCYLSLLQSFTAWLSDKIILPLNLKDGDESRCLEGAKHVEKTIV